jgi:metal-dependent amidase/aminoacylase/carboxypeptidase family protein
LNDRCKESGTIDSVIQEASKLQETIVEHRRYLHPHTELSMGLPVTKAYVLLEQLRSMGYEPKGICPSGIVALVGKNKTGKTFLLRADMDALCVTNVTASVPYVLYSNNMDNARRRRT